MNTFTYDGLINKLFNLGFIIEVKSNSDRDYVFHLEMNGVRVGGSDYPILGMYCGGAYNSCSRSNKKEFSDLDVDNAVKLCSKLLMDEIKSISRIPNYHTCKDYFRGNPRKTKIERDSVDRVFNIIKNEYNNIIRYTDKNDK